MTNDKKKFDLFRYVTTKAIKSEFRDAAKHPARKHARFNNVSKEIQKYPVRSF